MYLLKNFFPCRGLFEKDKLVFSFILCAEIMKTAGKITDEEWNYFLRGTAGMDRVSKSILTGPKSIFVLNLLICYGSDNLAIRSQN